MDRPIFYLEERGQKHIYHWFIFVVAGLCDLDCLEKPLYFHCKITEEFQRETLKLLEPEYVFIEKIPENTKVYHIEGTRLLTNCSIDKRYYVWLRNFFLRKVPHLICTEPTKLYYISRNLAPSLEVNRGNAKRLISNEDEIVPELEKLGFKKIFLEKYCLEDKIKIFQEAKVIVSPNGGALTMGLFAGDKTKILEINCEYTKEDMHKNICESVGVEFYRYEKIDTINNNGRPIRAEFILPYLMKIIDIPDFIVAVKNLL